MVTSPGPVRTCVGCRAKAAKTDVLRVVAGAGEVVPDPRGRLPGRGASLHPDPRCLDLAERRRAFPRALRLPGPLDTAALRAHLGVAQPPVPASPAPRTTRTTRTTRTSAPPAPPAPPVDPAQPSTTTPSPPTGSRSRPR